MFYFCPFSLETLDIVCAKLQISTLVYQSTEECTKWWLNRGKPVRIIPIIFNWYIWCNRNRKIFEGISCYPINTAFQILSSWDQLKTDKKPPGDLSKHYFPHGVSYPEGSFDGASQHSICGYGSWLLLSPYCHYKLYWNGGGGTNTKAEVLALWGLLLFASQLYMDKIQIIGDSKVVIDHMNMKTFINLGSLVHWLERINILKSSFLFISFNHV